MVKEKICIVCEFPPPPGGMSNQAVILCQYLKQEGYRISRCKVNITFHKIFNFLDCNITKIIFKLPLILFRIFINCIQSDIIHIFAIRGIYFYIVVTPAVLFGRLFRKRVIINYHAGYFLDFYKRSPLKIIIKYIFNSAHFVTTPLDYLQNEFSDIGVKITKVSNIVNLDEFTFCRRKRFEPKFICTRHLREVYGNDIVIRAFAIIIKKYPKARLTLAGDGDSRHELEDLVKDLGIKENVTFTGYIIQEQLVEEYERADIFLNGSRRDNMPISILESFALGLPVVSTAPMGIPYLVSDGTTGLLAVVNDYEGLAANAIKIIEDPQLGVELTENAKAFLKTLTWEKIYPHLSQVYFDKV